MAYYGRSTRWAHTLPYSARSTYVPAPADPAETVRIEAVINNPAFSSLPANKQEFIKSIHGQAANKKLSVNQINYLASIETSLVPVDNSWWNAEDAECIKKRAYAIAHYKSTGYYLHVVTKMEADPAYMPEKHVWEKMWANVYINAGFKRHFAGARWSVGSLIQAVRGYYGYHNVIVEAVKWSYKDNNWTYEVMSFEGQKWTVTEPDTKRVKGDNTRRTKKQG